MKVFGYTLPQIKKTAYSVLGFVVAILTVATQGNIVPEKWLPLALGIIGAATSALVFLAQNAPLNPEVDHSTA